MTVREMILDLIQMGVTDTEEIIKKVTKALRVKRGTVLKMLAKLKVSEVQTKAPKTKLNSLKISELIKRERLDPVAIIKEALADFGKDECVHDENFRKQLSISQERWRTIRNEEELLKYQVQLPSKKRVWAKDVTELLKLDGVLEVNLYV